jgi:two-component system OmpR family response regulator
MFRLRCAVAALGTLLIAAGTAPTACRGADAVDVAYVPLDAVAAVVVHPRRVLTRDFMLEHSRGMDAEQFDRAIDVQVSRLRRKLARTDGRGGEELIRTVRNEGYLFTADVERR